MILTIDPAKTDNKTNKGTKHNQPGLGASIRILRWIHRVDLLCGWNISGTKIWFALKALL